MLTSASAMVYVSDMERSIRFYTDTIGMTLAFRAGNFYATLMAADLSFALHPVEPNSPRPGTNGSTMVTVTSDEPLDALVQRLTGAGVRFPRSIVDDDPVRLAYFLDPDGNQLCCVEMKGAPR